MRTKIHAFRRTSSAKYASGFNYLFSCSRRPSLVLERAKLFEYNLSCSCEHAAGLGSKRVSLQTRILRNKKDLLKEIAKGGVKTVDGKWSNNFAGKKIFRNIWRLLEPDLVAPGV